MPRALQIRCRTCSSPLTKQVIEVDYSFRNVEYEQPYVPDGTVLLGMIHEDDVWGYFNTEEGAYVTNLDAGINMSLTEDSSRLWGCCGPGGGHGLNLRCDTCKCYVATKFNDCPVPQCIVYDPAYTSDETIQDAGT